MRKHFLFLSLLVLCSFMYSTSQSLRFNGSSNYVNIGNDAPLHLQSFTLEAWINIQGAGTATGTAVGNEDGFKSSTVIPLITKGCREKGGTSTAINYFFGYRASDRKLIADFEDNATGAHHPVIGNTALATSKWIHVAVTYAAGTWRLYINGVADKISVLSGTFTPQAGSNVTAAIGSALNSVGSAEGFFNGMTDEVRIWNLARSATDISGNYLAELTSGTGLVARYGLNEGTGSTAANSVSSTSAGRLINSPQWTTGFNQTNSITNVAPNAPTNPSPADGATSSPSATSLCVTASDPDGNPLRVRYYARKKLTNEKFTMIAIPDPQYYVAEPQGDAKVKGAYAVMFKSQTQWIANNRVSKNIPFVAGLGDCVDHGDSLEIEWKRVDTAIRTIENVSLTGLAEGIPYGLCVGNHDQSPIGDPKGTTTYYNKYFGTARLGGRSYYGGHNGTNNDNHYELFSASGIDFLVLCPEWDQTSGFSTTGGALDWMESIVKQYPKRKVIVVSHYVLNLSAGFSTQGAAIYNRLKAYPNFILMLGGHIVNFSTGAGEARRSDTLNGNVVHTITQDYQARTNGGNGLLRTYQFDPVTSSIYVQTYSPYTNMYETDGNSQFTLNVNLATTAEPYALIGEVSNVASGSSVCVNWPSVQDNTTYEWYAEAWDGVATTKGPVWSFKTKIASATTTMTGRSQLPVLEEQRASGSAFSLYPNPNNTNRLTLSFSKSLKGSVYVEIGDATGKVHLKKTYKDPGATLNLEHNLTPGAYIVVVKNADMQVSQRLMILK